MRPQIGSVINSKYRLVRLVGEGGMGCVFEARHEYLGTVVALKFLDPELAQRPGLVARFVQEARVIASIRSPHVVQVSDVDQSSDGLAFLVMELLEGESLRTVLARSGRLPISTSLDFAVQILTGLEAAHACNVVHRDLKPENVFILATPHGPLLKLLDFGIAKLRTEAIARGLTRPGVMMGTPEYMAPEQAFSADTVDLRADLYALGVMLFEMISGTRPFSGHDPRAIAANALAGNVPLLSDVDPSVPPALAAVVRHAMAPRVTDRFSSSQEMRAALQPFRSAATALPAAAYVPQSPQGPIPTEPELTPAGGVAPTLPPSEPQGPQPTGRTGTIIGDEPPPGFEQMPPMPPDPYGATAQAPGAPQQMPSYGPPPYGQPFSPPPPARKRSSSKLIVAVLVAVIGALAAAAVIAAVVYNKFRKSDEPAPLVTFPPATTIEPPPAETTSQPGQVSPPVTTQAPPATTTARPPSTAAADAGVADASTGWPDAGFPFPFPSAIPSGLIPPLPPLPSSLPPLPSGLPPLPTIPGWPPLQ